MIIIDKIYINSEEIIFYLPKIQRATSLCHHNVLQKHFFWPLLNLLFRKRREACHHIHIWLDTELVALQQKQTVAVFADALNAALSLFTEDDGEQR